MMIDLSISDQVNGLPTTKKRTVKRGVASATARGFWRSVADPDRVPGGSLPGQEMGVKAGSVAMNHVRLALGIVLAAGLVWVSTLPVEAQATRTWVSGVGDDANPCSRTAPCKTFAGAISKTAISGEINCLDPGGFGAVTITKSISIVCDYTEGGVLANGTFGFNINAPAGSIITLKGQDVECGSGTGNFGTNGVQIL